MDIAKEDVLKFAEKSLAHMKICEHGDDCDAVKVYKAFMETIAETLVMDSEVRRIRDLLRGFINAN